MGFKHMQFVKDVNKQITVDSVYHDSEFFFSLHFHFAPNVVKNLSENICQLSVSEIQILRSLTVLT